MSGDSAALDDSHEVQLALLPMPYSLSPPQTRNHSPSNNGSMHSVCLVEVAPVDSRFHNSDAEEHDFSWRIPLSNFTNRKTSTSLFADENKHLSKRIRKYYKAQDKLIDEFESLAGKDFTDDPDQLDEGEVNRIALRLSQISFAANLVLLVAKAVAVGLSGSISVISSLVDSAVDLLSGIVIWYTSRAVRQANPYLYPSGRRRLEPLAIVVLSVIMSLASFQVIIESVQKIIAFVSDRSGSPKFEAPTIVITSCTVVTKFCLFFACYMMGRKHKGQVSSTVNVLMQDHRNDILSNSVALICGYFGSQEFVEKTGDENVVFIDPVGAIIIGAYILVSWWKTGLEQINMLTGVTAKPEFLSKITWITLNHDPLITKIDTVRAFHFGSRFLVEVDIVLPKEMTLDATHGIGESLQQKLEKLKEVERAFVHVDWETEHRPEAEHRFSS